VWCVPPPSFIIMCVCARLYYTFRIAVVRHIAFLLSSYLSPKFPLPEFQSQAKIIFNL
jgi:hypothetical protein